MITITTCTQHNNDCVHGHVVRDDDVRKAIRFARGHLLDVVSWSLCDAVAADDGRRVLLAEPCRSRADVSTTVVWRSFECLCVLVCVCLCVIVYVYMRVCVWVYSVVDVRRIPCWRDAAVDVPPDGVGTLHADTRAQRPDESARTDGPGRKGADGRAKTREIKINVYGRQGGKKTRAENERKLL